MLSARKAAQPAAYAALGRWARARPAWLPQPPAVVAAAPGSSSSHAAAARGLASAVRGGVLTASRQRRVAGSLSTLHPPQAPLLRSPGPAGALHARPITAFALRGGAGAIIAFLGYILGQAALRSKVIQRWRIRRRIRAPEPELSPPGFQPGPLFLQRPPKVQFLVEQFNGDIGGPIVITGQEGSGKTFLLKRALSQRPNTVYLNLRARPVVTGDGLALNFASQCGYLLPPDELLGRAILKDAASVSAPSQEIDRALQLITSVVRDLKVDYPAGWTAKGPWIDPRTGLLGQGLQLAAFPPVFVIDDLNRGEVMGAGLLQDPQFWRLVDWAMHISDNRLAHVVFCCSLDVADALDAHAGWRVRRQKVHFDFPRPSSVHAYFHNVLNPFLRAHLRAQQRPAPPPQPQLQLAASSSVVGGPSEAEEAAVVPPQQLQGREGSTSGGGDAGPAATRDSGAGAAKSAAASVSADDAASPAVTKGTETVVSAAAGGNEASGSKAAASGSHEPAAEASSPQAAAVAADASATPTAAAAAAASKEEVVAPVVIEAAAPPPPSPPSRPKGSIFTKLFGGPQPGAVPAQPLAAAEASAAAGQPPPAPEVPVAAEPATAADAGSAAAEQALSPQPQQLQSRPADVSEDDKIAELIDRTTDFGAGHGHTPRAAPPAAGAPSDGEAAGSSLKDAAAAASSAPVSEAAVEQFLAPPASAPAAPVTSEAAKSSVAEAAVAAAAEAAPDANAVPSAPPAAASSSAAAPADESAAVQPTPAASEAQPEVPSSSAAPTEGVPQPHHAAHHHQRHSQPPATVAEAAAPAAAAPPPPPPGTLFLLEDWEVERIIEVIGGHLKDLDTVVTAITRGRHWSQPLERLVGDAVEQVERVLDELLLAESSGGGGGGGGRGGWSGGGPRGAAPANAALGGGLTPFSASSAPPWDYTLDPSRDRLARYMRYLRAWSLFSELGARKYVSRREVVNEIFHEAPSELDLFLQAGLVISVNVAASTRLQVSRSDFRVDSLVPGTYISASSPRLRVAFRVLTSDSRLAAQTRRIRAAVAVARLKAEEATLLARLPAAVQDRTYAASLYSWLLGRDTGLRTSVAKEVVGGAAASLAPGITAEVARAGAAGLASSSAGAPAPLPTATAAVAVSGAEHGTSPAPPAPPPASFPDVARLLGDADLPGQLDRAYRRLLDFEAEVDAIRSRIRTIRQAITAAEEDADFIPAELRSNHTLAEGLVGLSGGSSSIAGGQGLGSSSFASVGAGASGRELGAGNSGVDGERSSAASSSSASSAPPAAGDASVKLSQKIPAALDAAGRQLDVMAAGSRDLYTGSFTVDVYGGGRGGSGSRGSATSGSGAGLHRRTAATGSGSAAGRAAGASTASPSASSPLRLSPAAAASASSETPEDRWWAQREADRLVIELIDGRRGDPETSPNSPWQYRHDPDTEDAGSHSSTDGESEPEPSMGEEFGLLQEGEEEGGLGRKGGAAGGAVGPSVSIVAPATLAEGAEGKSSGAYYSPVSRMSSWFAGGDGSTSGSGGVSSNSSSSSSLGSAASQLLFGRGVDSDRRPEASSGSSTTGAVGRGRGGDAVSTATIASTHSLGLARTLQATNYRGSSGVSGNGGGTGPSQPATRSGGNASNSGHTSGVGKGSGRGAAGIGSAANGSIKHHHGDGSISRSSPSRASPSSTGVIIGRGVPHATTGGQTVPSSPSTQQGQAGAPNTQPFPSPAGSVPPNVADSESAPPSPSWPPAGYRWWL